MTEKEDWFSTDWLDDMDAEAEFKQKHKYYPNEKKTKESMEFYNLHSWIDNPYNKEIIKRHPSIDNQIKDLKENIKLCKRDIKESQKEINLLRSKKNKPKIYLDKDHLINKKITFNDLYELYDSFKKEIKIFRKELNKFDKGKKIPISKLEKDINKRLTNKEIKKIIQILLFRGDIFKPDPENIIVK